MLMFDQLKWNLCCKKEGVSFARKGTPEYERVLSCYRRSKSPSPRRKSPSPRRKSPSPRRKSPSPRRKSPSPRRKSPSPRRKSPSPRRKSPSSKGEFNKNKWEKACKVEGVSYARKGTNVYHRVLARYQDKPVVNMPIIDTTNLSVYDMMQQWEKSLIVNEIIVLLEGEPKVEKVIQDYILFCEEKREEKKRQIELNRREMKQNYKNLSPRSKKLYYDKLNSSSTGW